MRKISFLFCFTCKIVKNAPSSWAAEISPIQHQELTSLPFISSMKSRLHHQAKSAVATPVRNRFVRAALGLAMLVLTIQLFCMAFHRHGLTEQVSDCVSCYSASQVSGGPSVAVLPVIPSAVVMYRQLVLPAVSRLVLVEFFRTPPAHAPPVVS